VPVVLNSRCGKLASRLGLILCAILLNCLSLVLFSVWLGLSACQFSFCQLSVADRLYSALAGCLLSEYRCPTGGGAHAGCQYLWLAAVWGQCV
jgi:hypothetical protein